MAGINIGADWTGLGNYLGTVDGILQAVEDPRFEGDFIEHMMDTVSTNFMVETIAARNKPELKHVFEWGDRQSEVSSQPLFRLTRSGGVDNRRLGYQFLPSTKYVPLPDPARYGIKPSKLAHLSRHTFQLKALIMETKTKVRIRPRRPKGLFIPNAKAKGGYYMTPEAQTINPGGPAATGGFSIWWNAWFSMRATEIIRQEVQATESWLTATGAKHVRYAAGTVIGGQKVGGRFASGRNISAGYIDAKANKVKKQIMAEAKSHFDKSAWASQWDDMEEE